MNGPHRRSDDPRFANRSGGITDVYHRIVCRHQVEIEVRPARVELNFGDEWTANPIETQARFEAVVYNSDRGCIWEVRDLQGNPGLGAIDASGLYRAPPKNALPSGYTEIVVATAREDGLRKACAWVTLVGVGARPAAAASLEVWPKRVNLYFHQGSNNNYIDSSNKMRQFEATVRDSAAAAIQWAVDGVVQPGTAPTFLYVAPLAGVQHTVTVRASLQAHPAVFDEAKVLLLNYGWPGA